MTSQYEKFYLVYMENGTIFVMDEHHCKSMEVAIHYFNSFLVDDHSIQLNENGYYKQSDTVSFCVAEQYSPYA